jgi:hypothetical protein
MKGEIIKQKYKYNLSSLLHIFIISNDIYAKSLRRFILLFLLGYLKTF